MPELTKFQLYFQSVLMQPVKLRNLSKFQSTNSVQKNYFTCDL